MTLRGGISTALAAVLVVVIVVAAGAAVFLVFYPSSVTTTGQSTSSVVSSAANLVAAIQPTPQTACGGQTFSSSSLTINWGNLAPSTEGIQYVCLENTGTTPVTLAVTSTLSPSIGRVASPQAGSILNGRGIIQVELDLWISSSVQPGPISAFTITVGAKS
jgi:uncharacterized protein (UPF0333 family)